MKRIAIVILASVVGGGGVPGAAKAGDIMHAGIAGCVYPHTSQASCASFQRDTCFGLITQAPAAEYSSVAVYVSGIVGQEGPYLDYVRMNLVDFGIQYADCYVGPWHSCGTDNDVPTPGWPGDGTGNTVSWAACRGGLIVLVGWFDAYFYPGGRLTLGAHPTVGWPRVRDCNGYFDGLRGPAEIATYGGINPNDCAPVAVEGTTWGRIKSTYEEQR